MHKVIIAGETQRQHAMKLIAGAPMNAVVTITAKQRTVTQNARLWAMLSEVAVAKPGGRTYSPEVWKSLFMSALGHEMQMAEGLAGEPFPLGFRSSKLTVKQMVELQDFIEFWCAQNGVTLSTWSKDATQN